MPKTALLFDIDGTLLLTGGAGKNAFNRIFKQLYNENNIWDNLKPDGKTDIAIIKECYTKRFNRLPNEDEIKTITQLYIKENKIELKQAPNFRLMPYVQETLDRLAAKANIVMGLATGNFRISGYDKLKRGQIDHHFNFGGFACDSEDRQQLTQIALEKAQKYLGESPKEVYVIGDTIHDIRCGKAISAKTIAVCTGSTKRDVLENEKADVIIDNLSQLNL